MAFDIRAQKNSVFDELLNKAKIAVTEAAKAIGATVEFSMEGTPAADYNNELVEATADAIETVLGKSLPPLVTPGCEDFHFYSKRLGIKTAYIGLGANLKPGLHHPDMSFDLKALTQGKDILKAVVLKKLG